MAILEHWSALTSSAPRVVVRSFRPFADDATKAYYKALAAQDTEEHSRLRTPDRGRAHRTTSGRQDCQCIPRCPLRPQVLRYQVPAKAHATHPNRPERPSGPPDRMSSDDLTGAVHQRSSHISHRYTHHISRPVGPTATQLQGPRRLRSTPSSLANPPTARVNPGMHQRPHPGHGRPLPPPRQLRTRASAISLIGTPRTSHLVVVVRRPPSRRVHTTPAEVAQADDERGYRPVSASPSRDTEARRTLHVLLQTCTPGPVPGNASFPRPSPRSDHSVKGPQFRASCWRWDRLFMHRPNLIEGFNASLPFGYRLSESWYTTTIRAYSAEGVLQPSGTPCRKRPHLHTTP